MRRIDAWENGSAYTSFNTTRRAFIGRALAALGFAALPGGFLFAAPKGWKHGGRPNLVFGVVSDTHLRTAWDSRSVDRNYTDRYFVAALKYFRERTVDAVMHLGDLANNGQVEAMQFHADAWRNVFPKDRGIGGRKVERLFVTGNHDVEGFTYTKFMEQLIGDPEERARHLLVTDMAANWEKIWGEPYEEAWHKTVKGYHFFGQHYPTRNGKFDAGKTAAVVNACRGDATLVDEVRPVFLLTHRRPHLAAMNRAAGPLANTFGFHGHWHRSAANWNVVGLGDNQFPHVQCPACHSSRGEAFLGMDAYISKVQIQGGDWKVWKSRQGYVVKVYDDMLVIERYEFGNDVASLGTDWVMPLGKRDPHPFSKDELKKVIGEPQFRKGAKLEVVEEASASPCLRVRIPLADGNPDSRVYAYEVVVIGETGSKKLFKAVYAAGCNMGIGHEPNGGVTTLEIPKSELPPGKTLTFAVRPLTSLGTAGKPIAAMFSA